ncbi:heterokaryon incompatibility protein-domain-containing protein [Macrophomina phaseolina]|uniref:Heterokaryon incompatibility protein-domain-containing protein n=1 Tax=Macrophomina phaseolina TaxID=35725 RepID=A0ABQ8GLE1_9PEZI|nr:heterokaryon incompatibility protein-domain-containing protein [Macrophomina phaseolina]
MKRIPFDSLSLTFRHAVQVTRELGVRYLWIDSLCIIQGDSEDWAVESGRMGSIYAHSYVTIAADCSASGDAGLFNSKSVLQDEEPLGRHVLLKVPVEEGEETRLNLYVSDERSVPSNLKLKSMFGEDGPEGVDSTDRMLVTRGWTLQEAVLAPRVLHFTSKQLIWECPWRGYAAEDIFSVNLRYTRPTYTEMKNRLRYVEEESSYSTTEKLRKRQHDLLKAWYIELIELHYSTRDLTFLKDKLPAIAGVAAWTAQSLGCQYIAGMWRAKLEWALTWRAVTNPLEENHSPAESIASSKLQAHDQSHGTHIPSFSWACSAGQVSWDYSIGTFQETARVEDVHMELECRSLPFGCVMEGSCIRVAGFLSRHIVAPLPGAWNAFVFKRCGGIVGKIHVDRSINTTDDDTSFELTCLELGLGSGPELRTGRHVQPMPRRVCVLVLAPVEGNSGCYTRQGIADWAWDEESAACKSYKELRRWSAVTIY